MYSDVVCAIILCSSVKSSGEKTKPGVVSVIRKLPPLKIVFCFESISPSFLELAVGGWGLVAGYVQQNTNPQPPAPNHPLISSDFRKCPPRPFRRRRTL